MIAWMHTFSPARMWIGGLLALDKPLLHLHTQFNRDLPWATIDMDFMNLNQSAHGDREFAHLPPASVVPQDRRGPLAGPVGDRSSRALGRVLLPAGVKRGNSAWLASVTTCARSLLPRVTRSASR